MFFNFHERIRLDTKYFSPIKINGTIIAKVNETTPSHNDISYKAFDIMSIEIVGKPEDIIDGLSCGV